MSSCSALNDPLLVAGVRLLIGTWGNVALLAVLDPSLLLEMVHWAVTGLELCAISNLALMSIKNCLMVKPMK